MVLDISADGHHPTYLRWILESDLGDAHNVVLGSRPELFAHPEIRACNGKYTPHEINVDSTMERQLDDLSTMGLIRRNFLVARLYADAVKAQARIAPVDFVLVPFIDDCLMGFASRREAFGGVPWLGITMRTMFHHPAVGVENDARKSFLLQRILFERLLGQKSLRSLLTIDETLPEFARRYAPRRASKIDYLPDPANLHDASPDRSAARARLDLPANACLVALYGEISARKGLFRLLRAAADPSCSQQIHVVIAGRCKEPELLTSDAAYLRLQSQSRVHRLDGYLDSEQEGLLFAAVDCMWVGYENFFGMSGVMVLAGRHSLPVISSTAGLIGYLTRHYALGAAVALDDLPAVVATLNRLANEPEHFVAAGKAGMRKFADHTPSTLKHIIREKIFS